MRLIENEEIKIIEMDILKYIKNICVKNNLKYYLAYGTLLGAVRHKGFIPWDDDIDILMPRSDYFKLMEIIDKDKEGNYAFLSIHNKKAYRTPLAKVIDKRTKLVQKGCIQSGIDLGVYVDVFILDGLPNNAIKRKLLLIMVSLCEKSWYLANRKISFRKEKLWRDIILGMLSIPFKIIGDKNFLKMLDKLCALYSFEECKWCGELVFDTDLIFQTEIFDLGVKVEFENEGYNAPKKYDYFLKRKYGNYMELPKEDQRVSNHNFDAYIR